MNTKPASPLQSEARWHTGYTDTHRADREARRYWLDVQTTTQGNPPFALVRTTAGNRAAGHDYRVFLIVGPDGSPPADFIGAVLLVTALGRVGAGETLAAVL